MNFNRERRYSILEGIRILLKRTCFGNIMFSSSVIVVGIALEGVRIGKKGK